MNVEDICIKTNNPKDLDRIMQTMGAVVQQNAEGNYVVEDGGVKVRCYGDAGYVKFAIEQQGYGEVVESGIKDE